MSTVWIAHSHTASQEDVFLGVFTSQEGAEWECERKNGATLSWENGAATARSDFAGPDSFTVSEVEVEDPKDELRWARFQPNIGMTTGGQKVQILGFNGGYINYERHNGVRWIWSPDAFTLCNAAGKITPR